MHYCLDKEELRQLIEYKIDGVAIEDELLKIIVGNAESWIDDLCCLNYLFSHLLDKMVRDGKEGHGLIKTLYEFEEIMFLKIEEMGHNYIRYMLKNLRNPGLSLEDELVMLQNKIGGYRYESTIRY